MEKKYSFQIYQLLIAVAFLSLAINCKKDESVIPIPEYFYAIAAGGGHSLALEPNGRLWACGNNEYGQLGDGTNFKKNTLILSGIGYINVATGAVNSMGLKADRTSWTW